MNKNTKKDKKKDKKKGSSTKKRGGYYVKKQNPDRLLKLHTVNNKLDSINDLRLHKDYATFLGIINESEDNELLSKSLSKSLPDLKTISKSLSKSKSPSKSNSRTDPTSKSKSKSRDDKTVALNKLAKQIKDSLVLERIEKILEFKNDREYVEDFLDDTEGYEKIMKFINKSIKIINNLELKGKEYIRKYEIYE